MIRFIKRLLGHHVCDEFTQWDRKSRQICVSLRYPEDGRIALYRPTALRTIHWQERRCTICGKMEQRMLKN